MERRTMNAERRSHPRTTSPACPHCEQTRLSAHHLRDAGDLGPEEALRLGYCPVLAARRTATPYLRTAPDEQAPDTLNEHIEDPTDGAELDSVAALFGTFDR